MEKIIVKRFISLSLDTFIDSGVMPINLIESSIFPSSKNLFP